MQIGASGVWICTCVMAIYVGVELLIIKQKEMKKIGLFLGTIILSFTFLGCEPDRYYNYFITNNCNEMIVVSTLNCATLYQKNEKTTTIQINPNTTQLIHSNGDYQPLSDYMVEHFFKEIIITKGDKTSKVNYVNKDLWVFKKTSKYHADNYLTVYPEDFE